MEVIRDTIVKTRKPHKCWGCTVDLAVGSYVWASTSVDEGFIATVYWCSGCGEVIREMAAWEKEDGFSFGELKNRELQED